jgi:threonine/homoserine/homoserine lactone efflux protein
MMDMWPPWPFLAAILVVELTPGPNMGYLAVVTIRDGWRAGLTTVAGVTLGLLVCLLASIGGLAQLVAAQPLWLSALKWLGVGYFAWLALDAWRTAGGGAAAPEPAPRAKLLVRGFVSNLLNPKAALLYLALLPTFLEGPQASMAMGALRLGLIHIALSVVVHLTIVGFAASGRNALGEGSRAMPLLQKGAAVLLLAVAGWVALS